MIFKHASHKKDKSVIQIHLVLSDWCRSQTASVELAFTDFYVLGWHNRATGKYCDIMTWTQFAS